ncbi:MAG: hypothetical protein F2681_14805 [Actinobacteria bacterium]|uniref:Unannotated protein n=1 Tax=freshwater metagenome TaxID=449393 RepID=A0A6J6A9N1_9ZZZZ|nr:hypothetical protein [Actinomycetota bacterium]MSW79078.1 hypothetical protein [Actinomycetota bacterium]MSX56487.1 hypothetical protein [Actinomycetota bacterium]MSX93518.1 hypothetical protein [Actinomycetota bacterium]MSZ84404.1 hypothetical protein [Actinomycetota bacterium]
MAAQVWFSSGEIDITPGSVAVLQLTVGNLEDSTDTFVLSPTGMAAAWATISPATVTLFGGAQQVVDVQVAAPLLPSTTAGPTSLGVRVVPQRDPDHAGSAETVLHIAATHHRHLELLQPVQRGRYSTTFEMLLQNRGNTRTSCRMHLLEPTGRVAATFDPGTAGVEPGTSTLIRARVRAHGVQWQRQPRTVTFRIDADEPGTPTASASGTFVQAPMVPERLGVWAAGAAGVVALALFGWFLVVKPAVRDAADRAVATALPSTTTAAGSPTDTGPATSTSGNDSGTIVNIPIPVATPVGETAALSYTVPAGQRLHVTDIVVQNPNGDQGTLFVQRNDITLYSFRLDNILGDTSVPLVTPIEFFAGDQLVVTVTCGGVGNATATTCTQNVFASGVLLPA